MLDMIEPALANDPMLSTLANDPMDPIDSVEPTEPIESTELRDPMLRIEPVEPMLHRDVGSAMPSSSSAGDAFFAQGRCEIA
jgi:hypothetical protein